MRQTTFHFLSTSDQPRKTTLMTEYEIPLILSDPSETIQHICGISIRLNLHLTST